METQNINTLKRLQKALSSQTVFPQLSVPQELLENISSSDNLKKKKKSSNFHNKINDSKQRWNNEESIVN